MQPQLGVPVVSQFAMAEMVWVGTQGEQGKGYNVDRVARGQVYSGCRGALRCAMRAGIISGETMLTVVPHVYMALRLYCTNGQVYLL